MGVSKLTCWAWLASIAVVDGTSEGFGITYSVYIIALSGTLVGKLVQWAVLTFVLGIDNLVAKASWSWEIALSSTCVGKLSNWAWLTSVAVVNCTSDLSVRTLNVNVIALSGTLVSKLVQWAVLTFVLGIDNLVAKASWSWEIALSSTCVGKLSNWAWLTSVAVVNCTSDLSVRTLNVNVIALSGTLVGKLVQWAVLASVLSIDNLVAQASWSWGIACESVSIRKLSSWASLTSITVLDGSSDLIVNCTSLNIVALSGT